MSMTQQPLILVLLTCHNRKALTLRLLASLQQQQQAAELCVVLVDDGSRDGTSDAVRELCPNVHVLQGSGQLYWCGGMRYAQQHSQQFLPRPADYQLWLNDDVELDPDAIARLLAQAQALQTKHSVGAVVGAVREPGSDTLSYGGRTSTSRWWPLRMSAVLKEQTQAQSCDFINGNVCLFPAAAISAAGLLSDEFTHSMGDFDYGLRLRQFGFSLWQAAGSFGTCKARPIAGSIRDRSLSMATRLQLLAKPNQAAPVAQWQTFVRRHGGRFSALLAFKAQCRAWWPTLYLRLIAKAPEHKVVVVVQQVLRQYRLAFWQQLHAALANQNIRLLVLFGQPDDFEAQKRDTVSSPPAQWFIPCDVAELGPLIWQYHRCLQSADLVICEHASRHLLPWFLRLQGKKLAWWGHGYDHQAPQQGLKAWWKRRLLALGEHYFAYTQSVVRYLQTVGYPSSVIHLVANSQDCKDVAAICQHRRPPTGPLTALYCGSLYPEKRLELLIETARLALSQGVIKQLIIVGDGPQRALIESQAVAGIEFVGALFGQQKAQMFARADVVLNPGMTGLAILDAFNAGLPYITCADSAHSPEIDYLTDGVNGYLVQGHAEALCQALAKLQHSATWCQLSLGAQKTAQRYDLTSMVDQYQAGVRKALGLRQYQLCLVHHAYRQLGGEDIVVQREFEGLNALGIDVCLHQTYWPQAIWLRLWLFLWRICWPLSSKQLPAASIYWLHNVQGSYGLGLAKKLAKRGAVWQTLHNVRPLWPGGVFTPTQWYGPNLSSVVAAWREKPYHASRWLSALLALQNWRHRDWYTATAKIFCPSDYLRAQYCRAGYPDALCKLLPHFCPSPLPQADSEPASNQLRCLFVGRLDDNKGLPWLLAQWPALIDIGREYGVDCQLTVVCSDATASMLPSDVTVTSAADWMQMSTIYHNADLVLMPSLVNESFGNVVIEATAHGLPVVGSDAGALAELIPKCHSYCFSTGDPADFQRQFANAVQECLNHKSELAAIRIALWQQHFSAEHHFASLLPELREPTAP